MSETETIEQRVADIEADLPTLENGLLAIYHGDAVEYFEPQEIVEAYQREVVRRIAAGTYLPAN